MAPTVPKAAAEWMAFRLRDSRQDKDTIVQRLENQGLGVLTVKELKLLGDALYSMVAVIEEVSLWERRLPYAAKKRKRIDFLRRGLFRDDSCTILNERLLQDMRLEMSRVSSSVSSVPTATTVTSARFTSPTAAAAAASSFSSAAARGFSNSSGPESSNGSRKRPNHQMSHHPLSYQHHQQHHQQNRLSSVDATALFEAYMSQLQPRSVPQFYPVDSVDQWGGMGVPAFPFGGSTTMNQQHNIWERESDKDQQQGGNDSESSSTHADPDSMPRDSTEAVLLNQLVQMGFQNQETLDGIRQCRSTDNPCPSADEVMLHLVTQREEAEEARREDEVRLRSEDQRQEESMRREEKQKDSLSKATTGEDLKAIFPESWVLRTLTAKKTAGPHDNDKQSRSSISIILGSDSRNDFLEFLKLEEKSRKWYGWVLPSGYFGKVGKRLVRVADTEQIPSWATACLRDERQKLRSGLYELKEQLKGQPKIFLIDRPVKNDGKAEIVVIDDDD